MSNRIVLNTISYHGRALSEISFLRLRQEATRRLLFAPTLIF